MSALAAVSIHLSAPHEASANPPPPKILPDPPISAPTKDEAPTVVRKHEGVCYAFYPAGGTLPVTCPAELTPEPLGEGLLKSPSGRCQFIPFTSGGPGRTGYLEKCPPIFSEVATAGVIPESATKLLQALAASREKPDEPWVDPPQPARLDSTAPQQVGCGGCSHSPSSPSGAIAAVALVALVERRRALRARCAKALRARRTKFTFRRHGEPDRDL